MDTKASAKKNCKVKLSEASESLQNFFDVYAGIDAKMAQGKSVLNFDDR